MNTNIFAWIRSEARLTQGEMGREVDLTPQSVANYEAGLIAYPPQPVVDKYMEVWSRSYGRGRGSTTIIGERDVVTFSPSGILDAYNRWINHKRMRNAAILTGPNSRMDRKWVGIDHPFSQWRQVAVGSRKKFCMLFCVPYASLERYESSGYTLPDWLKIILLTAGVGHDELDSMDAEIKEWYRRRNARRRGV